MGWPSKKAAIHPSMASVMSLTPPATSNLSSMMTTGAAFALLSLLHCLPSNYSSCGSHLFCTSGLLLLVLFPFSSPLPAVFTWWVLMKSHSVAPFTFSLDNFVSQENKDTLELNCHSLQSKSNPCVIHDIYMKSHKCCFFQIKIL